MPASLLLYVRLVGHGGILWKEQINIDNLVVETCLFFHFEEMTTCLGIGYSKTYDMRQIRFPSYKKST